MKDFSTKAFNTLVRMMAEERFIIIHGDYHTASIDLYSRLIKLPLWADETHEVAMLFRMHECAHGLFTPPKGYHHQNFLYDDKQPGFSGYLNIMEDARIDRLMKRKFKGYAKLYQIGYRQLFNRGFFGSTDRDKINQLSFADRINIKNKTGFDWVQMKTPTESALYLEVMSAETFEDTVAATHNVYEYVRSAKLQKITLSDVQKNKQLREFVNSMESDDKDQSEKLSLVEDLIDETPVDPPITDLLYRKAINDQNKESVNTVVRSRLIDTSIAVKYNVVGYKDVMKLGDLLSGFDMSEIVDTYKQNEEDFIQELDDD